MTACLASSPSALETGDEARGRASYYANEFAGEPTASGEPYDPTAFTAAHPDLPFGTRVRVTRIGSDSGASVVVRINDRGPFSEDRIIDLSRAAAEEIGMIQAGVVRVKLTVLDAPDGKKDSGDRTSNGW